MNATNKKCVMVINPDLPLGLIANTAAILGCTLGKNNGEVVGEDLRDASGTIHLGIVNIPIPVLSGCADYIKQLQNTIRKDYSDAIELISFSDVAQQSKHYQDYTDKMSAVQTNDLNYLGICLYGSKRIVNHLTGSLPTLR